MREMIRYAVLRYLLRHPLWCRCGDLSLPCRSQHSRWAIR